MSEQITDNLEELRRLGLVREIPCNAPTIGAAQTPPPDPPITVQPIPPTTPPFNWAVAEREIGAMMNATNNAILPEPHKAPPEEPVRVGKKCVCGKTMDWQADWSNGKFPGWLCACGVHVMPLPTELPAKYYWNGMMRSDVTRLVMASPTNPTTRSVVENLAIGDRIPDQCRSFDQILYWFEHRPVRVIPPGKSGAIQHRPATQPIPTFSVDVCIEETETGRCSYTVHRSGSNSFEISGDTLLEIARSVVDDGDGEDTLLRMIREHVDDEQVYVNTDAEGRDYEYDNHESQNIESEGQSVDIVADRLSEWLRRQDEELYEAIYG